MKAIPTKTKDFQGNQRISRKSIDFQKKTKDSQGNQRISKENK